MASDSTLSFTVVVNTDGRVGSLKTTMSALRCLQYDNLEVCVVCGPTDDGTYEMVSEFGHNVKIARCPVRNLSVSRNIGIAAASGEIVAFIDDDAYPDPRWLIDLASAYSAERVGGAGGFVLDHTGHSYQYKYATADRLGNSNWQRDEPATYYNFPLSFNFPYLQGTNCSFRRSALLEIGGFDEEYEFYLDETDLCCRLVDRGYELRQLNNAIVYHKFLPSAVRNADKITTNRYPVVKNKLYFSIVNNLGHVRMSETIADMQQFVASHAADIHFHIAGGRLFHADLEKFWDDVDRAWSVALRQGLSGRRALLDEQPAFDAGNFRLFERIASKQLPRVFAFLSQDFPPDHVGGIARYTASVATALAAMGHEVHVLTRSNTHDRVDFEDGVWVHRIVVRHMEQATKGEDLLPVPAHIWNYSACMLEELLRIQDTVAVDLVEAPIWDCEGIAVLRDGRFATSVSLHTTLAIWLETHPEEAGDPQYMRSFGGPMIALEASIMENADAVHGNSQSILQEVRRLYGIELGERENTFVVPHGIADFSVNVVDAGDLWPKTSERVRLLFVGRLERRKGVDVLLEAVAALLREGAPIECLVVGDDTIAIHGQTTYRDEFEEHHPEFRANVRFTGRVSEENLKCAYRSADVLVVPSRYESFGLIAIEAMAFGLPVIAARAGGLAEVITADYGILVEPDSAASLVRGIAALVWDPAKREVMGRAARSAFERSFTATKMAEALEARLMGVGRQQSKKGFAALSEFAQVAVFGEQLGFFFPDGAEFAFEADSSETYIVFYMHDWSGVAAVIVNEKIVTTVDLYSDVPRTTCISIKTDLNDVIQIRRTGNKGPDSLGTEVIVVSILGRIPTSGNVARAHTRPSALDRPRGGLRTK